jgi:glycosyltransferase involved in cell wall biosynthesis
MTSTGSPARRLRVGYVLATFPASTETFIHREIVGLRDAGIDVEVYAIKRAPRPLRGSLAQDLDAVVRFYGRPDRLLSYLPTNARLGLSNPRAYARTLAACLQEAARLDAPAAARVVFHFACGAVFGREMRRRGVGAIHCHFTAATTVGFAASCLTGLPFSFSAHASGDIFVRPILLDCKLRKADFVVCVCEYSRRYLDSITGFRYSEKLVVVHNGLRAAELDRAWPAPVERGGDRGRFRILSVGSLVGCKGFGTLLETCALVRGRGHTIELLVLGDGPGRQELERLIGRYGLGSVVTAPGAASHDDVLKAMAEADAFALMAETHVDGYRDAFPTVILEAMAAGLPVVSTYVSGIPEAVIPGETGFLVRERDPHAAAEALERLIGDGPLRVRMGVAGRQRVRDKFAAEKSSEIFSHLLKRDGGAGPRR